MMGTADIPDYEGAKACAVEHLAHGIPAWLTYHSLWHTRDEVAPRAEWLTRQEGLSREEAVLVGTAAYFHDIGFIRTSHGHEEESARIAADVLPAYGYDARQIQIIQRIIYATRLPQTARNVLERIMCDADLDVLGRSDYLARNAALRDEKVALGEVLSDEVWYPHQLWFLQQHRYFTQIASKQRGPGKSENLRQMQAIVADCCPSYLRMPAALPAPGVAAQ
ncbi:MAG: HD domain-containing protein [Anaerolineae bacterium]|nr:HD domain-containing protein [Anaerolineae bacterium]